MLYNTGKGLCWFIIRVLLHNRIRVRGAVHVPRKGGFIVASNHLSNLDPVVVGIACPRSLNFMAKEELFRPALARLILSNVKAFPVRRGAADIGSIREAMRRVKKGGGLLLFPEGTRGGLISVAAPQPGVGMLAQKLGVPVIPAWITGTDKALPRGSSRPKSGQVLTVRFGAPVSLDKSFDSRRTAESIMDAIRGLAHG